MLFAARKARHTFSGLIGSVMSRTPRCHNASITALPIAAGAEIQTLTARYDFQIQSAVVKYQVGRLQ